MKFTIKEFDYNTCLRSITVNLKNDISAKLFAYKFWTHKGGFINLGIYDEDGQKIYSREIGKSKKWKKVT